MRQFECHQRLIRNWVWYVVFRIVQDHGEWSYFCRFQGGRSPQSLPWIRCWLQALLIFAEAQKLWQ